MGFRRLPGLPFPLDIIGVFPIISILFLGVVKTPDRGNEDD